MTRWARDCRLRYKTPLRDPLVSHSTVCSDRKCTSVPRFPGGISTRLPPTWPPPGRCTASCDTTPGAGHTSAQGPRQPDAAHQQQRDAEPAKKQPGVGAQAVGVEAQPDQVDRYDVLDSPDPVFCPGVGIDI